MPADLIQPFRAFAYNNAWANHRLLTACERLTETEFAAARTGFFPSLQRTLNHIYVIDLFYIDALEGGWLGPRAWHILHTTGVYVIWSIFFVSYAPRALIESAVYTPFVVVLLAAIALRFAATRNRPATAGAAAPVTEAAP